MMKSGYQNLIVWSKAMELVADLYRLTHEFPVEERYGLINQTRRCAVSIPSNIAEGSQRKSSREFSYFLRIAKGSTAELETQLLIANSLGYFKNQERFNKSMSALIEIRKMISGLYEKLRNR